MKNKNAFHDSRTVVVIPTFNEKENLSRLVDKVLDRLPDSSVLIVDDNSPDGTGNVAESLVKANPRVRVMHRDKKLGRGTATISGFETALRDMSCKFIVEMDADFSHDPRELPKLLKLAGKYDVVVGSRYITGSRIVNWELKRRIFSRFANFYARIILGIPIHDFTNGFRVYKRRALSSVDFSRIHSRGYVVLSEIAYQLYKNGFSFAEVPIVFVNRRRGTSNFRFSEVLESFLTLLRLRWIPDR